MDNETIEKAILNLISDPIDKENCFYGHIIAQCKINIDKDFNGIAGVGYFDDMFHLHINPILFQPFTLQEQKAVLIHEAMHIIFNHLSRKKDKNHLKWNIATDAAINQYIPNLPKGCIYPKTIKCPEDRHAEIYYENMPDDLIQNNYDISNSSLDNHELWDSSIANGDEDFIDSAAIDMIENAMKKSTGNIPQAAYHALKALKSDSVIPWQKILKRVMGHSKKYFEPSYKKLNRRFPSRIDLPGKRSRHMPTLVSIVDVSGSMSDDDISMGLIEIQKICTLTTYKHIVIQVDEKVQDISKNDFKNHKFTRCGDGGTDLYPAMKYIYEHNIVYDILVFITDGYFTFEGWRQMPKKPMFFLLTNTSNFELPTKKSYKFDLDTLKGLRC